MLATKTATHSVPEECSEVRLWVGGDVNLGGDGKGVLQPLAEMVKGATGIVNLEGPVAAKAPTGAGLKLLNAPEMPTKGAVCIRVGA